MRRLSFLRPLMVAMFLILPGSAFAQKARTLTGTITDSDNVPLPGAAVMMAGKSNHGTVADIDGKYSISIPTTATKLTFSYLGMETKEVIVAAGTTVLNIQLKSDTELEGSYISAGYGLMQKRMDLTSSAYQVNSTELKSLPKANVANMLEGLVPGLSIETSQSGSRDTYKIRVRGDASLSANCEPLWIVDDIPIYTGSTTSNTVAGLSYGVSPLSFLNPEDIESITVLKDAASTSIYGADGANGVILVTTKKGANDGKASVQASLRHGVSRVDPETLLKLCSTEQWWELAKEGWVNAGYDLSNFPYQDNEHNSYSTTSTNWYDVYLGMGQNTEANVSIRTGDKKNSNYLSLTLFNEDLVTTGNTTSRFSLRDRMSYTLSKNLKADLNLSVSYSADKVLSISSSYYRVIPIFSPYDEDGITPRLYNWYSTKTDTYEEEQRKFVYSAIAKREYSDNDQYSVNVIANGQLVYTLFQGVTLTSMFGMNNSNSFEAIYNPANTLDGITSYELNGYSHRAAATSLKWNNIDRININRSFGDFRVNAMGGVELTHTEHRSLSAYGYGFANDSIKEISYSISDTRKGTSSANRHRTLSYMANGSLAYANRYILSASYRRQGNSEFSTYQQWGDFTSVGASWNVNKEPWWNVPFMDKLKVRVSYGNSGNSRISTSAAYGTYSVSSGDSYGGLSGASQSATPNPGLSWEKTDIFNLGFDFAFFNGRLDVSLETYDKLTHDMLYSGRVSSIIDNSSVTRNVGSMENKGFEATVTVHPIKTKNFDWNFQFNGAFNKNKILELYEDMHTGFFDYVWVKGASKNAWWLSRWAGVDPVTGSPMWYDFNGNITYTFSYDNRVLLPDYDKQPTFSGGLVNNFRWGPVSLRIQTNYSFGGWDYINWYGDGYDILSSNTIVEELDHWRKPGDVAANPKFVYKNSTSSTLGSTRFLYSKTHIQLKNVALYYELPKSVDKFLKVSRVQLSLIGDNLYFWSPDQSKTKNSYKTMTYTRGITQAVSGQITIDF